MQCIVVPTGMFRSGIALPVLIGESEPFWTWVPTARPLQRDDVTALAVRVAAASAMLRAAVRVVLEALDLGDDAVLVALEIDHAVVLLVPAAHVARRDLAGIVAARGLALALEQRVMRPPLVEVRIDDLDDRAAAGRGRFDFDQCHYLFSPAAKLISWPGFSDT